MPRSRRNKRHKRQAATTEAQRIAMVPGDLASGFRRQHDSIELETRAATDKGEAVIMGEVVSTPVRKLYLAGDIGLEHLEAAKRFERHFDAAYLGGVNVLAKIQVDGVSGGGDRFVAAQRKAMHGIAFTRAETALSPRLAKIARQLIIDGSHGAYASIGEMFMPHDSRRDQSTGGKYIAVLLLQVLADVMGLTNPRAA